MLIYNVTVKIETGIHQAWLQWMKEEHIPEVISTGCFLKHQMLRLLEVDETEGPTYAIQYYAENNEAYQRYLEQHATLMRQKGFDRWGNRFIAFRSIMEVIA